MRLIASCATRHNGHKSAYISYKRGYATRRTLQRKLKHEKNYAKECISHTPIPNTET